jgi:peptidoglycan/LPS O-acetylase OafA/YrhL
VWGFFAGVLIFRLHHRGWRLPKAPYWLLVAVLVACMIRWAPSVRLYWARDLLLIVVVLPAIVAFAVNSPVPERLVGPAVWLGEISYPLYALHVPLLRGFRWLLMASPPLPIWERRVLWWTVFVGVILTAALYERYYDTPIRAWLGRRRARTALAQRDAGRPTPNEARREQALAPITAAPEFGARD